LCNWNVSNVYDMNNMFNSAESFNQDISNWDVSNKTMMKDMFKKTRIEVLPEWYLNNNIGEDSNNDNDD